MNKFIFHSTLSLMACLALATAVFAAKPATRHPQATKKPHTTRLAAASERERVTLDIWGADTSQAAATLSKALADNGLHANIREAKGKPYRMMTEVRGSQDLAKWGEAVNAAHTQNGQAAPGLDVVLFAPLTKESAQQVMTRLEQLKGVDAKHSTADIKNGELNVRVTGANHISADDIYNAVHSAGIAAHFTKTPSGRQS